MTTAQPDAALAAVRTLVGVLRETQRSVGSAESLTGGLLAYLLAREPGSGEVFLGAITVYDSEVKFDLLGVPRGPVVCEDAAYAMAVGARRLLGCDVALALTGVAGPDPQDGQPPGSVWGAVATGDRVEVRHWQLEVGDDPDDVRNVAVVAISVLAVETVRRD